MLDDLLMALIVLAALFVFVASLCRVNYLHLLTHQPLWVGAYALVAAWAAIEGLDAVIFTPDGTALIGLVGVGLWLWGSRLSWREGAPAYLERGDSVSIFGKVVYAILVGINRVYRKCTGRDIKWLNPQ